MSLAEYRRLTCGVPETASPVPFPSDARVRAGKRAQKEGRSWESVIEDMLNLFVQRDLLTWWRTPESLRRVKALPVGTVVRLPNGQELRVGDGRLAGACLCVPDRKGPPDYVALAHGFAIAIEAKETSQDRWPFSGLAEHQADALDAWERQGGVGLIFLRAWGREQVVAWTALAPRWRAWNQEQGRAAPGAASLSREDVEAMGWPLDVEGGWLERVKR
jgi:hypothetical protein